MGRKGLDGDTLDGETLGGQTWGRRVAARDPAHYSAGRCSERSAARLAHQSGGLGVASSNLAAPTIIPPESRDFSSLSSPACESQFGTKPRQATEFATWSPEKLRILV